MGLQTFYGKGPHTLLCAGLLAAGGKITASGIPKRLNFCIIFIVYTVVAPYPSPLWILETVNNTEPYIPCVFLNIHTYLRYTLV